MSIHATIYIAAVSLLAAILTIRDKNAARKNGWRVKERTLLAVSVIGGSAAMLVTMLAIRHKTRRAKFMVGIPLIILIQVVVIMFVFNSSLSVSHYEIDTDKIEGQLRLALIADLHSCDYGDGQIDLISAIDTQSPDAVLLCGDIFDDNLPPENAIAFIKDISGKYLCYYVSGNHEFWSRTAEEFKTILESYGVTVLEGTSAILEIGGNRIRISGIDDPDTDRYPSRSISYAEQLNRLREQPDDGLIYYKHILLYRDKLMKINLKKQITFHSFCRLYG